MCHQYWSDWLELLLHLPKKTEDKHHQYRWDIENCCKQHHWVQNLGELDLEWDAITEILDENGNRVHTTLYYAKNGSVNFKHNKKVTKNWKSMALKVGNKTLLNHSSAGDASSSKLYYPVKCNKSLWNQCIKIDQD